MKMVKLAGAEDVVTVKSGQDFLQLDPQNMSWSNIGSILLDPSCSGSGIVGRDDVPNVTLPQMIELPAGPNTKKRKRQAQNLHVGLQTDEEAKVYSSEPKDPDHINARLKALSAFQLKLLLHASRFQSASCIVYSTCSIHAQENEHVVAEALKSMEEGESGWRILHRQEQISGMQSWPIRGHVSAFHGLLSEGDFASTTYPAEELANACIRCEKNTQEGTQGFFVACFVRREQDDSAFSGPSTKRVQNVLEVDLEGDAAASEAEWEGFSDAKNS